MTDCFDAHEHLNPSGARKVSDYLGLVYHSSITMWTTIAGMRHTRPGAERRGGLYREKKLADFENQSELASALMLLHDDDFACTVTIGAGNALFENEKLMTLMQNIAREHVFEEDLFAKWSNSLSPLEALDEAAQSGQSYAAGINRAAGEITETVGADVPEGVHITLSDPISGETLCEKEFFSL